MASYQAKIQLLVEGSAKLKQLEKEINGLEKKIDQINKKSNVDIYKRQDLRSQIKDREEIVNLKKDSVAQTRAELLQQVKLNSAVRLFNRRLDEAQQIGTGLADDRKDIEALQQAFDQLKGMGDIEGVQALSTELGRIVEQNKLVRKSEVERFEFSKKIANAQTRIAEAEALGLDVSKAKKALEAAQLQTTTNRARRNKIELKNLNEQLDVLKQQTRELDKQAKLKSKQRGSAIIGGAFPLLFGQGPGAAAGGAIGGALGEALGIGGFAGSLAGTAIGDFLDTAVVRAAELADALSLATSNMEGLREAGIEVTASLQRQVEALTAVGRAEDAQRLAIQEAAKQTGDLEGKLGQLVSGSLSELQKAWKGVLSSVSTLVGVIAAPFIQALTAVLRAVQAIAVGFNALLSLIGQIGRIGGIGDALTEAAIKGSEEYQKRQVELLKESDTLERNLKTQEASNQLLRDSVGLTSEQKEALNTQDKVFQSIVASQKEVAEARKRLGQGRTAEERANIEKQIQLIQQKGIKDREAIELAAINRLADRRIQQNKDIAKFNLDIERQRERIALSVERKIFDQKRKNERALQDLQFKRRKAELNFEKQLTKFNQQRRATAQELQATYRNLAASISGDPQANIGAQIADAVEKYKLQVQAAQEDRVISEKEIELKAQESAVRIERLKLDNARAIARFNEDTATRVEALRQKVLEKRRSIAVFESGVAAFQAQTLLRTRKAEAEAARDALVKEREERTGGVFDRGGRYSGGVRGIKRTQEELEELDIGIAQLKVRVDSFSNAINAAETNLSRFQQDIPQATPVAGLGAAPGAVAAQDISAQQSQTESLLTSLEKEIAAMQEKQAIGTAQASLINNLSGILSTQTEKIEQSSTALQNQNRIMELTRTELEKGVSPELAEAFAQIEFEAAQAVETIDELIASLPKDGFEEFIKQLQELRKGTIEGVAGRKQDVESSDALQKSLELQQYIAQLKADINDVNAQIISLSNTVISEISTAMSSAITGVIDGTQTVEEAMSTMFANIGKAFIDMATQMIAKALIMKALNIFFGGDLGTQAASIGAFAGRAVGGPVKPNSTYLVGEQGPELLTMGNQSGYVHRNTSEAMDRYRAGGSSNGGGGSLNINYNVTQINGMNFVTEEQFKAGMTRAAKDGAKMGEAGTFRSMRNSRSSRARVGL